MADINREAAGRWPLSPRMTEVWEEHESVDGEERFGPARQFEVWFDEGGLVVAKATTGLVLLPRDIAARWGQHVLDDLNAAYDRWVNRLDDGFDAWVDAMESRYNGG